MSGSPFTLDFATNKGLGTTPGSSGVAMNASKPQAPVTIGASFRWLLEDGNGYFRLEDDSGDFELEDGP